MKTIKVFLSDLISIKRRQREVEPDILRGIAMIGVLICHTGIFSSVVTTLILPFELSAFWCLSGYMLAKKNITGYKDEKELVIKRFCHIIGNYFFYNELLIVLFFLIYGMGIKDILFAFCGSVYSRWCLNVSQQIIIPTYCNFTAD